MRYPESVSDFIPIACCSTLYKCITNLLSEKLNKILPDIISGTQGDFVSGRSILHKVLICHGAFVSGRSIFKALLHDQARFKENL